MTKNEFDNVWNELAVNLLTERVAPIQEEITLVYNPESQDYSLFQVNPFNKTKGGLLRIIRFTIDFGSIQSMINIKGGTIDLNSEETRTNLANDFLRRFDDVHPSIGTFNGMSDNCDELADFIIDCRGSITGSKFGL